MEAEKRNVWIIAAVILLVLCCCAAVVAAVAAGGWLFTARSVERGEVIGLGRARVEQTFDVGDAPSLEIDNFAGNVTVRAGESGTIRVVATKKGSGTARLEQIRVTMTERDGGVKIETRNPSSFGNASVQIEITAPADADVDLHTGAGSVDVRGFTGRVEADSGAGKIDIRDVTGEIVAKSNAGSMEVRGAIGPVRLDSGAGSITYQGTPQGDCRFESGAGSITLVLPAAPDVEVDLDTGMGSIDVGCDVEGRITRKEVEGVIGSGDQGKIVAVSGVGSIDLDCR